MEMIKGDIVLIPFPFTDLSGNKLRPAVTLSALESDVIVCFITSKMKWKDYFDVEIKKSPLNGLKVDSILKSSKIATLDKSLLVGKLGQLTPDEVSDLDKKLIELFNLKVF